MFLSFALLTFIRASKNINWRYDELNNYSIGSAMTIKLDAQLPNMPSFMSGIRRAPNRGFMLTQSQTETALKNALRYVPEELHQV